RPLQGRRIVVTRARAHARELVRALEELGAEVVAAPAIRIEPLADLEPLRAALTDPGRYDWIVFTSQSSVQVVCERLGAAYLPPHMGRAAVAAIGPATATALLHHGIDRKSTRLNSSHVSISYAVFCLKKKKNTKCTP